jgi:ubiquinone/menaquinone biosynthesis C-methylase UbiE
MSSDFAWYQSFFEHYLRIYGPFLSSEQTEREVDGMVRLLNLVKGTVILDLACGYGRHALALARRGYRVTGLDLSRTLLAHAEDEARNAGLQVRFLRGDMRSIPYEHTFDVVTCLFSSFGYFELEEDNQEVLDQVYRVLKPGGLFLLDIVPQSRGFRSFSPSVTRYEDGLLVLEERQIDWVGSRQEIRVTLFFPNEQRKEYRQSVRLYTLTEIIGMLADAGLEFRVHYGSLDGQGFTADSRLVVVSQKVE